MNPMLRLIFLFAVGLPPALIASSAPSQTPGAELLAAVRAADDARVAATLAGNRDALAAVLSDDLRYAHSSGSVDTKASLIDAVVTRRAHYRTIDYTERTFIPAGPGIVLMAGRCAVQVTSSGQPLDLHLSYLAVWREEQGRWRFLAWQSCRLPASGAAAPK